MLNIDFEKIFNDLGIFEALKKVLKENTGLEEKQANEFLKQRIKMHGEKAHEFLNSSFELQQNKQNLNPSEQQEIDKKLDGMIKDFENNYKQSQKLSE
jgi:hypothetical protein